MRTVLDLNGWWHTWFDLDAPWEDEPPADPRTPLADRSPRAPSGGWEALEGGKESTRVPGTWDASRPGYRGVAWHWRPLIVPEDWDAPTLRLRFGGVRLRAEVYIDRRLAGYDLDGMTPFEVDVTGLLVPGRWHVLTVRVTSPGGQAPGRPPAPTEWAGLRLPPGPDLGGIWGGVSLLGLPTPYLDDAWAEGDAAPGEIAVHVRVRNDGPAQGVRLTARVLDGAGQPVAEAEPARLALPAQGTQKVALRVRPAAALAPWFPDAPALYGVAVALEGAQARDEVRCRLALRCLGRQGDGYTLNGRPMEFRAAESHGRYDGNTAAPESRAAEEEVRTARALGLNALRFAGHAPAEALLDAADRLGLLVLVDPALAGAGTDVPGLSGYLAAERRRRLNECLRAHPSALWAPAAEGGCILAGVPEPAPLLRALAPPRPALPDLARLLARHGDRALPGSEAQAWAAQLAELNGALAARGMGMAVPDAAALSRATGRAALAEVARAVEAARALPVAGYLLPAWADAPRGAAGLVSIHREPKADGAPLAHANGALHLTMAGLPLQASAGAPGEVAVRLVNRAGLRGAHSLAVRLTSPAGRLLFEEAGWVALDGGPVEELTRTTWRADGEGEHVLGASLYRDGRTVASARRSVWVAGDGAPAAAGQLATLAIDGALQRALDAFGVHAAPYAPGAPARGLLVCGELPGSLANALYAGAVRRLAWLAPDLPEPAGWAELLPALGSVAGCRTPSGSGGWLIGGRHALLSGAGDPGVWWHVGEPLLPRYGLRDPLALELVSAVCPLGEGASRLLTVLGLGRLGEAELLFCALPLAEGLAAGVPVARRLLANVVRWLSG